MGFGFWFSNGRMAFLGVCLFGAGCIGPHPTLAPSIAQPNTRPARNFTSFAHSLRCMDRLLAQAGKGTILISSSGFPDKTDDVSVGADDMLINAINQLNRSNRRYVFLDQARISGFGQLEIVTTRKEDEVKPSLYIRGSISQVDEKPSDTALTLAYDRSADSGISESYFRGTRTLSVVSVDMHLVQFPSRRVLAGASVANSMVVKHRRFEAGATGIITHGTLGLPLRIERIESKSQAVRNLIEVGVIELLGRHSGVPYWTCLDSSKGDAKNNEQLEKNNQRTLEKTRLSEAQDLLSALGYLGGHKGGQLDAATRRALSTFQGRNNLLPNGIVDFDTMRRLRQEHGKISVSSATQPDVLSSATAAPTGSQVVKASQKDAVPRVPKQPKSSTPAPTVPPGRDPECVEEGDCEEVYKNLYHFLKNMQSSGG